MSQRFTYATGWSLVLLLVLSLLFGNRYALATDKDALKIRVGDFFPNSYKDENGRWQGIDIELVTALMERADLEYTIVNIPWSRALLQARHGEIDIVVNTNITRERSDYLYWIGPERYTQFNLIVQTKHKELPITNLDDLVRACHQYNKRFGYQQDVKYGEEFKRRLETDREFANCMESTTKPLNDDKVLHERLLGYFDEPLDVMYEKRLNPDYGLFVHPFVVIREPVFFAISKSGVDIPTLLKLHIAYESLLADGTFQSIRDRWETATVANSPDL